MKSSVGKVKKFGFVMSAVAVWLNRPYGKVEAADTYMIMGLNRTVNLVVSYLFLSFFRVSIRVSVGINYFFNYFIINYFVITYSTALIH